MSWRDDGPLPAEGLGHEYELELERKLDELESMPMVKSVKVQPQHNRILVNVWCRGQHTKSSEKQPSVARNKKEYPDDPTAVPTYLVAAQKLMV